MLNTENRSRKDRKNRGLWEEHWREFVLTIFVVCIISAIAACETYRGDSLDATKAGQFGDFIGGYVGTLVLVASVALIFASFRNQRQTNERTAFENRFFELLKFHRENVSEIGIGSTMSGRRVFVSLIREFRECLRIVEDHCASLAIPYTAEQRIDLAYLSFYYGVGPNSTRVLKKAVAHHPAALVSEIITELERIQKQYRESTSKITERTIQIPERASYENYRNTLTRLPYCPFDGHQSRLGHYYRHLYQVVKYIDAHAPGNWDSVREYASIVRAQMTNHEQALLCINALSKIGEPWISTRLLIDYEMIKNIPSDFFDPADEIDLEAKFPTIEFEFKSGQADVEPNRSAVAP